MILTGYFDDSGTHAGSAVVVVAGFLSTTEQWAAFETEWREALRDFGLGHFHMREFSQGVGPYKHWPEAQRRIRFGRLLDIVNDHIIGSFGTAVPVPSFERIFSAKAKAHVGGPYGLAASSIFLDVGKVAAEAWPNDDPWIAYVFESGTRGAGQVLKVFQANEQDAKQKDRLRLLSLRLENKRQFVPLQAADILAYELYQHLPRQLGTDPRPPRRYALNQLRRQPPRWGYLDDERLTLFAEAVELSARIAVTEGWPHRKPLPDDWTFEQASPTRPTRRSRRRSKRDP
ncbi:MAG TPA: DUF3800 domain-containing protein [Candidatus Limnocylindria bacterium]|nr:DUF3800 domain-containing protein [Candidatus Limnocylindria bacterium]